MERWAKVVPPGVELELEQVLAGVLVQAPGPLGAGSRRVLPGLRAAAGGVLGQRSAVEPDTVGVVPVPVVGGHTRAVAVLPGPGRIAEEEATRHTPEPVGPEAVRVAVHRRPGRSLVH